MCCQKELKCCQKAFISSFFYFSTCLILLEIRMEKKELEIVHESNLMIDEGAARIIIGKKIFYNPIQEFNRDLTVMVLKTYSDDRDAKKSEKMEMDGTKSKLADKLAQKDGGIRILDALSASGLRAIRFALEVPNVELVVANDFSEKAFETIQRNAQLNQVDDKVKPNYSDAIDLMLMHRKFEKRFHAIDLDPYGSAAIFLDSAIQAVADGGILMVTSTDTAILCGNRPEACFNKYGSIAIRHKSCHEMALRILIRAIDSHANRYGRYIVPLLSISADSYIRCFVQIQTGAAKAKDSPTKLAYVFSCARCQSLEFQPVIRKTIHGNSINFSAAHFQSNLIQTGGTKQRKEIATNEVTGMDQTNTNQQQQEEMQPKVQTNYGNSKCTHCGGTAIHMGGPIYVAPIHEPEFVQRLLERLKQTPPESHFETHERLVGMLTHISEELHEQPLFYEADQLMNLIKCPTPKMVIFLSALLNAGFRCSGSHCNPKALKTNAPVQFIWDVCRAWAKKSNINIAKLNLDSAGQCILGKKQIFEVNFTLHREAIPPSKAANILRFQENKNKNLGPNLRPKLNESTIKSNESTFKSNESTFKTNQSIFRSNQSTFKSNESTFKTNQSTFRSNQSTFKPEPVFPKTPDHYWEINFPSPGEQIRRGYIFTTESPLFKKQPVKRIIFEPQE